MARSIAGEHIRLGIVMPLAYQLGGAEVLLVNWLKSGASRHVIFCAFLQDGPLVEIVRKLGIVTAVFPTTRISNASNFLKTVKLLRHWIRQCQLGVVLSWMPKGHLYSSLASLGFGVKTLWFQHGIPCGSTLNWLIASLPVDLILCCSQTSLKAQTRLSGPGKVKVCYPGVSFATGSPISQVEARIALGLPIEKRIVGMVARWERWKGIHIFLGSAERCAAEIPESLFFLLGGPHPRDPSYADEVRAMVDESEMKESLLLLGSRPPEEVQLWQAAADLIVHSVTGTEPFGMAVVESMGMGKVVIASDAAGPKEIIEDGVNGFLVPSGDVEALADLIIQLSDAPERIRLMAPAASARGRDFSMSRFTDRVDDLVAQVLR